MRHKRPGTGALQQRSIPGFRSTPCPETTIWRTNRHGRVSPHTASESGAITIRSVREAWHEPAQDLRRRGKHLDARQGRSHPTTATVTGRITVARGGEFDTNADTYPSLSAPIGF